MLRHNYLRGGWKIVILLTRTTIGVFVWWKCGYSLVAVLAITSGFHETSCVWKIPLFLYYPPPDGNTLCHPLPPARANASPSGTADSCPQLYGPPPSTPPQSQSTPTTTTMMICPSMPLPPLPLSCPSLLENVQKAWEKRRGKTRVSRGEVRHELFLMKRCHLKVS